MTYKEMFVAEVKVNGKILRVKDDAVYIPFGSEYSIFLKNLNSRRSSVKVSIDGESVLDNSTLILDANTSVELEGFIRGTIAKNRFKFIQKTKRIQEYRGDKIDDGLIRVEFAFEKYIPKVKYDRWEITYNIPTYMPKRFEYEKGNTSNCLYSNIQTVGVRQINSTPLNDEGITVKGSQINQQFNYASIGVLEQPEVIIIKLRGMTENNNNIVDTPITVDKKIECKICGTKCKSLDRFCSECGTCLV